MRCSRYLMHLSYWLFRIGIFKILILQNTDCSRYLSFEILIVRNTDCSGYLLFGTLIIQDINHVKSCLFTALILQDGYWLFGMPIVWNIRDVNYSRHRLSNMLLVRNVDCYRPSEILSVDHLVYWVFKILTLRDVNYSGR